MDLNMQTDFDAYRRMGNPYAKLANIEDDAPPGTVSAAIRLMGNPYLKLSMSDDDDFATTPAHVGVQGLLDLAPSVPDAQVAAGMKRPGISPPRCSISRVDFTSACRSIFAQYEPMRSGRRQLRTEFRAFIAKNCAKAPEARAKIIAELERYDLSKMGNLQPHLNRECEQSLLKKLADISAVAD